MKSIIQIEGTSCHSCKALIEEIITEVADVTFCNVDYKTGRTEIEHTAKINLQKIKQEIEALYKYKVKL